MSLPGPGRGRGKSRGPTAQGRQRPRGGLLVGAESTVPKRGGVGKKYSRLSLLPPCKLQPAPPHWPSPSEIRGQANLKDSVQELQPALDRERGGEGQRVDRPSGGAGGGCYGLHVGILPKFIR